MLLIHGFPLDHTMWNAQIDALSDRCRVIAPDLRGFGKSTLATGDAEHGVSMEKYADDLAELLDTVAVREPVVVVGFSMGGYIAWQFIRKYADRVRALVQCDTKAAADTDEARAGRLKMAEKVAEWGSGRVAEMMGPKLFSPATFESNPQLVAAVRHVVEKTSPQAIAAAQADMAERPDMTGFLPTINVPTLVIVGAADAISPPKEMQTIAAAIQNAEYVEIPDAGHMTTMENPEAVNETLRSFIATIVAARRSGGRPVRGRVESGTFGRAGSDGDPPSSAVGARGRVVMRAAAMSPAHRPAGPAAMSRTEQRRSDDAVSGGHVISDDLDGTHRAHPSPDDTAGRRSAARGRRRSAVDHVQLARRLVELDRAVRPAHDDVLDPGAVLAREVDPGLHGEGHARPQRLRLPAMMYGSSWPSRPIP